MHYGVPGMKWGHRKALPKSDIRKRYESAKSDYKEARKQYNKSYNKAHNYSSRHIVSQFVGKKAKAESDRRWDDALDKAVNSNKAKKAYRKAKSARKDAIKKAYKEVNKNSSFKDKMIYNDATRKKAAKYMVDNNMSMADARKKANNVANRNAAIAMIGIIGAYGVSKFAKR